MNNSWLIGNVLKKCGVPCAYEVAMMLGRRVDDDAPIPTAIYTLADVAGKAVTKKTYNGTGSASKTHTNYAVGQFPLSITAKMTDTSAVTYNGLSLPEVYLYPIARAGDFIEVTFIFPNIIVDCESYIFQNRWFNMYGVANSEGEKPFVQCGGSMYGDTYDCTNGSVALFDSDFVGNSVQVSDGNEICMKFSGTLLHDVDYIEIKGVVRSDGENSIQPYNGDATTTFGSYSDFTMKVYEKEVN